VDIPQLSQVGDHGVPLLQLRLKLRDLLFIGFDDFVKVIELCLDGEVGIGFGVIPECQEQLLDFCDFFFILFFLEEESMLFQEKQVDAIKSLEVVVSCIDVVVILVLHGSA
jgi:hypothetical protein